MDTSDRHPDSPRPIEAGPTVLDYRPAPTPPRARRPREVAVGLLVLAVVLGLAGSAGYCACGSLMPVGFLGSPVSVADRVLQVAAGAAAAAVAFAIGRALLGQPAGPDDPDR